jgi:formaldehyde-activating enzyme involved in methanogenesis
MKKRKLLTIVGTLAVALILAGASLVAGTSVAHAAVTAEDLSTLTQASTGPGLLGDGYLAHGGWPGGFPGRFLGGQIDYSQLLADALGITVDDLNTAYEEARVAAIGQAVDEGLITQEQADRMIVWGGRFKFFSMGRRQVDGATDIDETQLLADALNMTVEELQTARQQANGAAIAQAVEEGIITQEQADQMQARRDLQTYLDRQTLLAEALGMSVEELQAAYENGQTLSDLLQERNLDAVTVRDRLQAAYQDALAQAVQDGVITQEQADELQAGRGWDLGLGMPNLGGRGGFSGRGHPGGRMPRSDEGDGIDRPFGRQKSPDQDDSGSMNWQRPGRSNDSGSAL